MTIKERIEMEKRDWELLKKGIKRKLRKQKIERNKKILKFLDKVEENGIADKIDDFCDPIIDLYNDTKERIEERKEEDRLIKEIKKRDKELADELLEKLQMERDREFDRKINYVFQQLSKDEKRFKAFCKKYHVGRKIGVLLGGIVLIETGKSAYRDYDARCGQYKLVQTASYNTLTAQEIGYQVNEGQETNTKIYVVVAYPAKTTFKMIKTDPTPEGAKEIEPEILSSDNSFENLMNWYKLSVKKASMKTTSEKDLEKYIEKQTQTKKESDEYLERTVRRYKEERDDVVLLDEFNYEDEEEVISLIPSETKELSWEKEAVKVKTLR